MRNDDAYESARLERVKQVLLAMMGSMREHALFKDDTIRMILADAWDELRMKPTALSPRELEQLDIELARFTAQRAFNMDRAAQYAKMLLNPYFARVDFREDGEEAEEIVIGLYSLPDPAKKALLVHDWRAPVCSLYYDALPGRASYMSPSGPIEGTVSLKRQYRIENGQLKFYVDTDVSIEDAMLLDVLGGATSARMRQIVSTIQSEQNRAIRAEKTRVLCVTGGAGSGKTSVAMHRAAYLLYHHRDTLDAEHICVLSPTNAFSEYISDVLPDLGEKNVRAMTVDALVEKVIGMKTEAAVSQYDRLMAPEGALRRQSAAYKSTVEFVALLDREADRMRAQGPAFEDIYLGKTLLLSAADMRRMYREEIGILTPMQRLSRISVMLESRLREAEKGLYSTYEKKLLDSYKNKELDFATRMAVAQKLHPVRSQIKALTSPDLLMIYAKALREAPAPLYEAARENAGARLIWREDGPGIAYLAMRLGMCPPDTATLALLVDEAQDHAPIAMRLMNRYFPRAGITLLGDPNQRTMPGMPPCDAGVWGSLFDQPDAPVMTLTRGYRCTRQIAAFCREILPEGDHTENVGRDGDEPTRETFDMDALRMRLKQWQDGGARRLAVICATHREAKAMARAIKGSFLLTGDVNELEDSGVSVGCLSVMKGLEFDAVAVVWPMDDARTEDGARRLYTACTRALHHLALYTL